MLFGSKGLAFNSTASPDVINSRSVIARSTGSPLRPSRISMASLRLSKYFLSAAETSDGGLGIPGIFVGVGLIRLEFPPSIEQDRTH